MKIQKKDITSKIGKRKKDSLWNHFLTSFHSLRDICADVEKNKISVWSRNFMTGNFYTVFIFEFNSNDELIKVSDKLNIFGKLIFALMSLGFSLPFWGNVTFNNFNINKLIYAVGFNIVFITVFLLLSRTIYRFEKKEAKEYYFKLFDIEENIEGKQKPRSERSLKNTIIRVLIYLFCFFCIVVGFSMFFDKSDDKPFKVILGGLSVIVIPIIYIYSDLKILFGKKLKK